MTPGTRLGPYEIVAPIGAGGMGEVYKARDTRLDRAVAIKILPAEFAHNAQFKVRFEREAKTISQLSHPNICALYDVGENYIVMELLDGESLADRLAKAPLPLNDVLKYGGQIAQALGRAHRAGVIHRDLKPGNVMLTKHGAKLLDFGLAKGGGQPPSAVQDVTQQRPLTAEGTVLGTFQYMAPEQLAGEEPDARTDIFALGVVLYEMATGRRAFEGKTKTSLVAAILSGEPKPMSELQPLTPRSLEHVVNKCLAKEPDDRWQSAADIAEELRWIGEGTEAVRPRISYWLLTAAVGVLALVIGAAVILNRRPPSPLRYSEITAPEGTFFAFDTATAVLSPNGREIATVARTEDAPPMIWVRPLSAPAAHPLKGTENALFPFWSPDSSQIGFFADGKLKRIDVTSGSPETLADASTARGGTWGTSGVIVFAPTPASTLYAVPAAGGEVRQASTLDVGASQGSHRFPYFLPDGKHFLLFAQGVTNGNVVIGSLDPREPLRPVGTADAAATFAPPDHLLFVREGSLRVQRFDPKTMQTIGEAVPIAERVQMSGSLNFANVSVSTNGLLSYVVGSSATLSNFTFFDKAGKEISTVGQPAEQLDPRISPDGRAVLGSRAGSKGIINIWHYDLRRSVTTRMTFAAANEFAPVWSPDGKSFAFVSFDQRPGDIFVKRVDASGPGEPLYADRRRKVPSDWSRDGNYVIYFAQTPGREWDIEAYSIRDHKVIPLVHTPRAESLGHLSPDGRWLAYQSLESGKLEIYVQPFPQGGGRWQVSGGGGAMPAWSRDGRELYYITIDGRIAAVTIHADPTFSADAPRILFKALLAGPFIGNTRNQYDVAPDGTFLVNVPSGALRRQTAITLVENWTQRLGVQ
jgi:serine/threonine protein kinase